jgi:hypothetical protein
MSRRRARGIAVFGLAALRSLACGDMTGPSFPADATPIEPLPEYAGWWTDTERCAGRHGLFAGVLRYAVWGTPSFLVDGREYNAYWWSKGNRIALAEPYVCDPLAVRHEMLHAILRTADHPREFFVVRCAGVVSCNQVCQLG